MSTPPPGPGAPAGGATLEASTAATTPDTAGSTADEAFELPVQARDRYGGVVEHARGGLGRVLRADDRRLGRQVAIKEMLAPEAAGGAVTARFVREALVTARLQHPGIVPVYDAGRWPDGAPFYAMKLVSGETLREAINRASGLDERLALVPRVLAAVQAVAYAHAEGVIHRDLKPSNVVLGPYSETVVIDWGLAKDLRAAETADGDARPTDAYALSHFDMTHDGAVVGTPGYMAPEQAAGAVVDARADVYALGAMLYHLLAGAPPYEPTSGGAETPERVLAAIRRGPPPPIAARAPSVPRDLAAIVSRAMARRPEGRYPEAGGLATDLQRFLSGQLVSAREYGWLTVFLRFLARRRLPVAAAAVLLLALGVTAAESFRRVVRARAAAEARGDELVLAQARAVMDRDPTAALAWLKRYPATGRDQAAAAAIAADAVSRGVAKHVLVTDGAVVLDAAFAPNGALLATVDGHTLGLWDSASGAAVRQVPLVGVLRVAWAPDGLHLGAVGEHGDVWLVDVAAGKAERLGAHLHWSDIIAFDPAGGFFATAGADGDVRIWPVDGRPPRELVGPGIELAAVIVTQAGHLVTGGADGVLRLWPNAEGPARELHRSSAGIGAVAVDLRDRLVWAAGQDIFAIGGDFGDEAQLLGQHAPMVQQLAFSTTGRVVSASGKGTLREWPGSGGAPIEFDTHGRTILSLAVGPAGALAAGDERGDVWLWRGGDVSVLHGHAGGIRRIAFRGDGELLSAGTDGSTRLWSPPLARRGVRIGQGAGDDAFVVAWSPRSDGVVAGTRAGAVVRIDPRSGQVRRLGTHAQAAYELAFTPGGEHVISGGWEGTLGVWPLDGGPGRRLEQGSQVWALSVSPDGRTVASASDDGSVWAWDLARGTGSSRYRHATQVYSVAFSPDGRWLASSAGDGSVRLSAAQGGAERALMGMTGPSRQLTFSPNGEDLYAVGSDGSVRAWATTNAEGRLLAQHARQARALALSPDGRTLASGGSDNIVRVVDLESGRETTLSGHEAEIRGLAFSPDGRQLASASWDASVRLWTLGSSEVVVLRGHEGFVHRVAFSPDGEWLASSSADGTVAFWRVPDLGHGPPIGAALQRWLEQRTSADVAVGQAPATRGHAGRR